MQGERLKEEKTILLVGSPNVGKSLIFNQLTGIYTNVSNYPGTTVEIARGLVTIDGENFLIIDTPGLYSLRPMSEEERVSRDLLLTTSYHGVIHVVEALKLRRMLLLTLELLETGIPLILVLNMMDEAEREGITIRRDLLEERLKIPVIETVSTKGYGMERIKEAVSNL